MHIYICDPYIEETFVQRNILFSDISGGGFTIIMHMCAYSSGEFIKGRYVGQQARKEIFIALCFYFTELIIKNMLGMRTFTSD